MPILTAISLLALWALLTHAAPASWLVGLPFIALAIGAARYLRAGDVTPVSLPGLLRFVPFFLRESVRGGYDVARRVLGRRLRVQPGFANYPIRLRGERARLLFANSVSLLPGTLAADLAGDCLVIHALDASSEFERELAQVESRVAQVFGETL
ncbi:MAG: Na+/H+ antiporter subunit E [Gammaproteobacteria bacterium]|nr:Na+/H+ antiporter subunit E [Gammaproteobacteria bacterium]